jgi:hypothetical protein
MSPYIQKKNQKTGGLAQGIGPEFEPQSCKQQKTRSSGRENEGKTEPS